jgi:hypothetical protein
MSENNLGRALENDFSERWDDFIERLESQNRKFSAELTDSWSTLQEILIDQLGTCAKIPASGSEICSLRSFLDKRAEASRLLLHEPVKEVQRRRPYRRALMAVETHRESLEGLIRSLPMTLPLSGAVANAVIHPQISGRLKRRLVRLRHQEHPFPLRSVIGTELQELSAALGEIEGRFFMVLALAERYLRKPWEAVRATMDAAVLERPALGEAKKGAVESELNAIILQGEQVLSDLRASLKSMGDQVGARILSQTLWRSVRGSGTGQMQTLAAPRHWDAQIHAADNEIQLEQSLEACEQGIMKHVEGCLQAAGEELQSLRSEINEVLNWLRASSDPDSKGEFPQPQVDVVPASSRLAELESQFQAELERLPQTFETLAEFSIRHQPRHMRLRRLLPRDTILQALQRRGRQKILDFLQEVESQNSTIVQQIERAREVVAFAQETAGAGPEYDPRIVQEATQNVISLLEFYVKEKPEWRASADQRMVRVLASVFIEIRLVLGLRRLGFFTYLIRQGLLSALALAGRQATSGLHHYSRRAGEVLQIALTDVLIRIGWKSAPSDSMAQVITRPYLPEEFTVDLSAKDLPLLYRRLFRFEPLQDPRFLVGREKEMGAITSARSIWERGRPVGIIIVGQRGSGKTSLINCSLRRILAGQDVVRGEFGRRLVTEAEMRIFLSTLMEAGDPAQLESFLLSRRRVIILEELERSFLRQVGHYGALRELLRIIAATSSSVLWILSTNHIAFQFMNASVNLSQSFSHRINAGTAGIEDLHQAIMLRHNLSGLRLQFTPPSAMTGRIQKLRRLLTDRVSPETLFFNTLAHESAGVYRSAFEIWLGQIDIVQNGTLYMKPLLSPEISEMLERLTLEDLFTLVAIPQHGSLTAEEHAIIFQKHIAHSRAQLNELLANEIIEADPAHPGFRIRPEAMRVVKEALYSHNLL